MRFIFLLLFPFFLSAHPHLFIDIKIQNSKDILKVDWIFDEMNSEILILDYDINFDRSFSQIEKDKFFEEVISDLVQQYNFYTFLKVDNKEIEELLFLRDFDISIVENNFLISFSFDLSSFKNKDKKLIFYDESFMSAFQVKKSDLSGFQNLKISEHDEFYGYLIHWRN
jgi:ABC-type uncharacterized transport system substrate-binding protein